MTETVIPLDVNERALTVLRALEGGPKTTLELHQLRLIHPARQVWELRHWYGVKVKTGRLPNRVAVYSLVPA